MNNSEKENHKWFVLEITVDAACAEAVEFALNELSAEGTEINNLRKDSDAPVSVIGYFREEPDDDAIETHLNEALSIYGFSPAQAIHEIRRRTLDDNVDWLYEWKKHWQPTRVGTRFIVAPTWHEIEPEPHEIIIRIDPAMAFGTGTHQTTQLCLKAIEENFQPAEMSFLDVGTGTGILAIATAKLQISNPKLEISACDTDENSVTTAIENAELNKVSERINFYEGSINEKTLEFDFVCANLTADVIIPLLPLLTKKAKRFLVLSGILKEQEASVVAELEKFGITNPKIETDGEWISIVCEK